MDNKFVFYNLYNRLTGKLVRKNLTFNQICNFTGSNAQTVGRAIKRGCSLLGKYIVKVSMEVDNEDSYITMSMLNDEWDNVRKPFLNVKWVKDMQEGVKKLKVK